MSTSKTSEKARFDARLSRSQKELFEQAAKIKGYKSLSEFVIQVTQEAAITIIQRQQNIIASERDQIIFFNALTNPPKPGKNLKKALKAYKQLAKTR